MSTELDDPLTITIELNPDPLTATVDFVEYMAHVAGYWLFDDFLLDVLSASGTDAKPGPGVRVTA